MKILYQHAIRTTLKILRQRTIRTTLIIVLTLLLSALLVATIYFTRFDPQWITFLGGVLFAAVLAMASQMSKTEWLILRRSKQLERVRELLAQEIARGHNIAEALRATETRMRLVNNQLPVPLLYADRDERCRYHNKACREWLNLPGEKIDGQLLRDIFGGKAYPAVAPQVAQTLAGASVDYELAWPDKSGTPAMLKVRQFPYASNGDQVLGFYLILTRPASAAAAEPAVANDAIGDALVPDEGSEALYLRSITGELMSGGIDPRARLARALQRNEFLLFAQKILPLADDVPEPDCYEVLLRLQEEEDNLLPPGGFIAVAEHYGMLEEIDRWVVRNLITWCLDKQRSTPGWRAPLFCVNLSDATIDNPEFAKFVRQELQRPNFPPRALCFEISEQEAVNRHDNVRHFIAALKPAGCRFTIDAFGSAKVSFSHLRGLSVDFLKIDGTIIQNMLRDPAELAKARAINTVCRKISVRTIAEFVETEETLAKLRELGVDYVQGFGIARPGPINELA